MSSENAQSDEASIASPQSGMSVPLLRTNSAPQPKIVNIKSANLNGRQKSSKNSKYRYSIDHAHGFNSNGGQLIYPPLFNYLEGNTPSPEGKPKNANDFNIKFNENQPQLDLAAMSVLSLLDNTKELDAAMDTDKDLRDIETPTKKVTIEIDNESEQDTKEIISEISDKDERACNCNPSSQEEAENHVSFNSRKKSYFECPIPTIYFNDGKRSVDFVIVWDTLNIAATTDEAVSRRNMFEANLEKEGLELEREPVEKNGLQFLKIHAPHDVLRRYGEILKLRMPMKEEFCKPPKGSRQSRLYAILSGKMLGRQLNEEQKPNFLVEKFHSEWQKVKSTYGINTEKFPEKGQRFTAIYSRDREYLFDVDSPCFFTPAIHSRVVQFILDRKRFSENPEDDFAFGIERLLNDKVYIAAYPLHDGELNQPGCMRNLLHTEWASVRQWYRYQPLDYVKEYFGVKISLYFAWLGFYTHMLLPAAIVGIICFAYSFSTMYQHKPSKDICDGKLNITMCPQCDHYCTYWNLTAACLQSRITYLFDNSTTVFFAIFMSIWATTFLELWKRYSAEITHRWDVTGFDVQEEHPRPQYLARLSHVKRKRINIVTNTMEPHVPFWRMRVPATVFSFSVVLLLVALAFATVAAVVLYRMSVQTALKVYPESRDNSSYVLLFITVTAASINLCCIVVFNWIYSYLAQYLTELEFLRTQSQFDDSLTLKIYLLQFVNYYASIFYIAFFKGKFVGHPKSYKKLFGHRQEECALGGCLMELCIQLGIIMVGKQALNTVLEMLFPLFYKWMNTLKIKTGLQKDQASCKKKQQWVKDFKLVEWGPRSLFPEYLEMVLQYGFVTIFVAAFPLAPFFALINNVLEMRLDASKLLVFYRRPVTQRVRDIGVWYRILDSIGKLSVITNGFIIAFTSDFIPRIVYRLHVSNNYSLEGYLNHSLAVFNTSDYLPVPVSNTSDLKSRNDNLKSDEDVPICRYPDYREPPGSPNEYELTALFWHILAARLAFVVIFENVAASVIILVKWLIPDVPGQLRDQIRRENYITNEIIIQQEALRAKASCTRDGVEPPVVQRLTLGVGACPTTPDDWDQIIDRSLSESDFDLLTRSSTYPPDKVSETEIKTPTSV